MKIRIRDWDTYFEADRSRQWKKLSWVPVPNKQGLGYKKIMLQKNGAEIFGCWNALIQQGSLCNPRGDLSKYTLNDLSTNTLIPLTILKSSINFIIQNLDWIEVIENLDKNVNENDKNVIEPAIGSSILCNSLNLKGEIPIIIGEKKHICRRRKETVPAKLYGVNVLLAAGEYQKMVGDWGKKFTDEAILDYDTRYPNSAAIRKHTDHNLGIRDYVKRGFLCQGKTPQKYIPPSPPKKIEPIDVATPDEVHEAIKDHLPKINSNPTFRDGKGMQSIGDILTTGATCEKQISILPG
jgi:hypothetical protein